MTFVISFAELKGKNKISTGFIKFMVIAVILVAIVTSFNSLSHSEQTHFATTECELDVDTDGNEISRIDLGQSLDCCKNAQFRFCAEPIVKGVVLNLIPSENFNRFQLRKRCIAFCSLKVFC